MGLQRVRKPTPIFFPGKSHGQGGLWQAIVHRVAKSRTWPHYWADNIVLQCSFDWYLFDINETEGFLYAYWLIIFLFLKHPFYCLVINFILLISDISHFFFFSDLFQTTFSPLYSVISFVHHVLQILTHQRFTCLLILLIKYGFYFLHFRCFVFLFH